MARPDGRIEKGQSLKSAISARAWNRAQDAADRVLGVSAGLEAGPNIPFRLPSVRITLRDSGWFGQCRFAAAGITGQSPGVAPTVPVTNATLGNETSIAKSFLNYTLPPTVVSRCNYADATPSRSGTVGGLLVCTGNNSNEYAMSGFAITRLRVFSFSHRYARSPFAFSGQTSEQEINVRGCLDSAFWGPATIVGYLSGEEGQPPTLGHNNGLPELTYPQFVFRWAVIYF